MARLSALSLLSVLVLGACAEQPVEPSSLVRLGGGPLSIAEGGTYLVQFRGHKIPADFSATVAAAGGTVVFAHDGVGIASVTGLTESGAAALESSNEVAAVDADAYTVLDTPTDLTVESLGEVQSTANPATAAFFPRQWHMHVIGAPAAWAAGKLGSASTRVGIIDTGIDYTNLDLAGLVDLTLSMSFVVDPVPAALVIAGAQPYADYHFHGTHVAATVSSNAVVGAGVTSKVTLVALKVCRFNGTCSTSSTLNAILYAADQGLDVVNISIGGPFFRNEVSVGPGPSFISTINRVFNYANSKGTTIVVAAGNAAIDMDHDGNSYNAYCDAPAVICASATGPTARGPLVNGAYTFLTNVDALAPYSNFGRSAVSVAAPGGNAAPVWATCSKFSVQVQVCRTGNFILGVNGTSMASPHTAGLAALIAGDVGRSPSQIAARIQQTADDLGQPGTDPAYGKGRINVARGAQ